jgi:WD40-like Beta Propeller Repeat
MVRIGRQHLMTHRHAAWFTLSALLMAVVLTATPQQNAGAERQLEAAIHREQVLGDVKGAIEEYKKLAQGSTRTVAAQALIHLGQCYEKLGEAQAKDARTAYERVVRDFGDQSEIVAQARVRLAVLGGPGGAKGLVTRRVLADASGVGGTLSPDGKYIRHIDEKTGDVVQFEVASGQTSRIANRGPWNDGAGSLGGQALSRDGKQIAYNAEVLSDAKEWVYPLRIRNLDGSGLHTLYSEKDSYIWPFDWSPDAGSILAERQFIKDSKACELTLVSTADGSVRVLRSIPSGEFPGARFSPDGRFVAFNSAGEGNPPHSDVFVMTADGRNEAVVAGHPATDHLLGWAPDGKSLVFVSDRLGTWDPLPGGNSKENQNC